MDLGYWDMGIIERDMNALHKFTCSTQPRTNQGTVRGCVVAIMVKRMLGKAYHDHPGEQEQAADKA